MVVMRLESGCGCNFFLVCRHSPTLNFRVHLTFFRGHYTCVQLFLEVTILVSILMMIVKLFLNGLSRNQEYIVCGCAKLESSVESS